jgi:hypothetical protein
MEEEEPIELRRGEQQDESYVRNIPAHTSTGSPLDGERRTPSKGAPSG